MSVAPDSSNTPSPHFKKKRRWIPSLVWLVPLVAALFGLTLIIQNWVNQGPLISIQFNDAQGLEAGSTLVKYKNVNIGYVKSIHLSQDLTRVLVNVRLTKEAQSFATQNARFWIVRPRINTTGVSGLNTLISGAYISSDPGNRTTVQKKFIGLETPPAVTSSEKGSEYILKAQNLGSINIATPVYYRHVDVGQVTDFSLDPNGKEVNVRVFIKSPYDHFITQHTRWWHASGIDLSLNAEGLSLNAESFASIIAGGIAFQNPNNHYLKLPQAKNGQSFTLAANKTEALAQPDMAPLKMTLIFNQSLRGLSVGAPVDFRGINIGSVKKIQVLFNDQSHEFTMPVSVDIYPSRLGHHFSNEVENNSKQANLDLLKSLVQKGLRAQLQVGNLLTNQLFISLDFHPKAPKATILEKQDQILLPTTTSSIELLQKQIQTITNKLNRIPFDEIGKNLNQTLSTTHQLLEYEAPRTLKEITRTTQSIKQLSDYLEQHPEAILKGKRNDER